MRRVHEKLRLRQGSGAGDGPEFVYFGVTYPCTVNSYSRRTVLEVGGQQVEADMVFFVLKDLFLTAGDQTVSGGSQVSASDNRPYPVSGRMLSFCGRRFRITAVVDALTHSTETQLQLVCVDPTK